MKIVAIAAMASNRVIGKAGTLPWDIPEDMRFFRDTTKGHIMIMGRKTFASMGVLPKRFHIVVSRDPNFLPPNGVKHALTPAAALDLARAELAKNPQAWGERVFIIGGGEIYRALLPMTDTILLTEIQSAFDGDATFPEFGANEFKETRREIRSQPLPFAFVSYERIR